MKSILYIFLNFTLVSFVCFPLIGQISLDVDSTFTQVIESDDINAHNTFENQVPQQIDFVWNRNIIENTDGWEYGICDAVTCYLPSIGSATLTLSPNEKSILDVHLYTNGIYEGYSMVEMKIEHVNDSNVNIFAYYIFDSELTTSTTNIESFQFQVYPNPSDGIFNLEGDKVLSEVNVYDLSGQLMQSIKVGNREWINLSHLERGTYIIQLYDREGVKSSTKLVNKI